MLIPVIGGQPKTLELGEKGVRSVQIHPNGKEVALEIRQEESSDVVALENFLPPLVEAN